ncbi:MAG: nucleoside-specific channel-forming protein Tsx [Comamonas sp.]
MKKPFRLALLNALLALTAATAQAQSTEATAQPYLSDWWHQSVNVVASHQTRFGPYLNSDLYLEYEAYARTDWLDFYGYVDIPKTFGTGSTHDSGVWDQGSPLFVEVEPRVSLSKITGLNLSSSVFKEWYFANDYVFDLGPNKASRQNTWFMGLGTDIDTGTKLTLSANVYAKYQWENYGAGNENRWDGYRVKIKYFYPLASVLGGSLSYIGFTDFDFGSKLRKLDGDSRSSNSIASSHVLSLNYTHWHFSLVERYFHNGGHWQDGATLDYGDGSFRVRSTGWGTYLVAGYSF